MSRNAPDIPVELRDVGDVVAPEEHLGADHARGRGRIRGGGVGGVPLDGTPSPQLEMISFLRRRRTGGSLLVALLPLLEGVAVENPEILEHMKYYWNLK